MRHVPITIVLSLAVGLMSAQEAPPEFVDLARTFDVGTMFRVEMEKGRREFEGDTLASDEHSTSYFTVEVVEAAPEGFVAAFCLRTSGAGH